MLKSGETGGLNVSYLTSAASGRIFGSEAKMTENRSKSLIALGGNLNLRDLLPQDTLAAAVGELPGAGISTDIIVGFPGETEEEYLETLQVMEEVIFDRAFMFKYSSRPGTKAAEYTDQINEAIKQNRLERLIKLQHSHTLKANLRHVGKILKVLVEKGSKKSSFQWTGRTEGNMGVIFNKSDEKIKDIVDILINDAKGISLFGSRISEKELMNEIN